MDAYEKIVAYDSLKKALIKSCQGVMWKDSVARYRLNAIKNTWRLRRDLLNHTYHLSPYCHFKVKEPKERDIDATCIRDRQFQRSLCDNYLYDALCKGFIHDNCACQKGKGVSFAHQRMKTHLRRYFNKHGGEGWVLQCDIRKYFPSTPHNTAKDVIRKRVDDDGIYQHVVEIIDSFGGDHGIGLGSQTSQLIELTVLDDIDHYVKERLRIRHYIRYMDDILLIHQDKAVLENALAEIKKRIEALGLELNQKTQIYPIRRGIKFLKWRYILTSTGKIVKKMDKRSITRERKKLKKLAEKVMNDEIPVRKLYESYQSWANNAKTGHTKTIIRQMDQLYERLYQAGKEYENEQNHWASA